MNMRLAFLLMLILSVASCNKDKLQPDENSPLIGYHEWTYSEQILFDYDPTPDPEMIDFTGTQDRYGLRIKKNGKAWLFKNGKVEVTGYLKEISDPNGVKKVIQEKNGYRMFEITHFKGEFGLTGYPFEGYYNFYKK